jgi:hypothetical protein
MKNILGKILAAPVRMLNVPIRIFEDFAEPFGDEMPEDERTLSKPLDIIADGIEKGTEYVQGKDRR